MIPVRYGTGTGPGGISTVRYSLSLSLLFPGLTVLSTMVLTYYQSPSRAGMCTVDRALLSTYDVAVGVPVWGLGCVRRGLA